MEEIILAILKKLGDFGTFLIIIGGLIAFNISLLNNPLLVDSIEHNLQYMLIISDKINEMKPLQSNRIITITIINAGTKPLKGISGEIEHLDKQIYFSEQRDRVEWNIHYEEKNLLFELKKDLLPGAKKRIKLSISSKNVNYDSFNIIKGLLFNVSCQQAMGALVQKQKSYNIAFMEHLSTSLFHFNLIIIKYFVFPLLIIFLIYKFYIFYFKKKVADKNQEIT